MFLRVVQKIKAVHCVNISTKNGLVHCNGCDVIVGIHDVVGEDEVITFINVREVLFRPHTSYTTHFATNHRSAQQVIYTEMVEHGERCFTEALDVANVFVFPIVDLSVEAAVDVNQPSTSSGSANPVIRVAAFTSDSLSNIDENRITKHFVDAITIELKRQSENTLAFNNSQQEQVADVSTPIWCLPENVAPNGNGTSSRVQQTGVRLMDLDLDEFLLPKDVDDKQTDCSDIDLEFFKD